jgi:WhiB family transcriptional regulator, redox-sensing transcriptional regulator
MTWLVKYFTSTGVVCGRNSPMTSRYAEEGVDTMDWRHIAACREVDPELFFPIGNSGPALLQIEEAKQVCRRCSVLDECLRWAIDSGQDAGVWGGLSEDERRALKRRTVRLRARAGV